MIDFEKITKKQKDKNIKEAIYVMTCGCHLKATERVIVKNRAYQCPNHPEGRFDHFIKECEDCGSTITPKGAAVKRCDECQKIAKKESNRRSKYRYLYGIELDDQTKQYESACNAWDCKHRDGCLVKHSAKKYLPCFDCDKYEKISSHELMANSHGQAKHNNCCVALPI